MLKNPSAETLKTALLYLEREEKDESFLEARLGVVDREALSRIRIAIRELRSLLAQTLLHDWTPPPSGARCGQPHGSERDWR